MPEVTVSHNAITSDEAKSAPKRVPVPEGEYMALIMAASPGATRHDPPLAKISVEFQILHAIVKDTGPEARESGRRVWQDYILEQEEGKPDMNDIRRFELRQLLESADAPFTDTGFNTDHLHNKNVIITVRHREGSTVGDDGKKVIFSNVVKVNTATPVDPDSLV